MKYIYKRILLLPVLTMLVMQAQADSIPTNLALADQEMVEVAYRKIQKQDVLGAVYSVDYEALNKKNYDKSVLDELNSFVAAGMFGYDGALIIVDGVPRDASYVKPNEVASVTYLKGASAVVLYGTRAHNGAIIITTKRGIESDLQVTVNANSGLNFAKEVPEYLGSAEYMTLYNEARFNDGLASLYSNADIYNHSTGLDPYRYPNVDLYSTEYLRGMSNRTDASVQLRGGTAKTKYYSNIQYTTNDDFINFGEAKNNRNSEIRARGNIDFDLSNVISVYANANIILGNNRSAIGDYWGAARTLRPNRISPLIPISSIDPNALDALTTVGGSSNIIDDKYFLSGTQLESTNIIADYYAKGYQMNMHRAFQFNVGLTLNLEGITKGLTFGASAGIDYDASYMLSYDNKYAIYEPLWSNANGTSTIIGVTKWNTDEKTGSQNVGTSLMERVTQINGRFDYNRSFGEHNVSAMLLASGIQNIISGTYHKPSSANMSLLASYNYAHKYYVEFAGALVHSAKLAEGNRQAISPSATIAWNVARENFLEDSFVDDLLISASASELNYDSSLQFYQYSATYGGGAQFAYDDGLGVGNYVPTIGGNPDLTYVKRKEISASLRAAMFNRSLFVDFTAYKSMTDGGVTRATTMYPAHFVSSWPSLSYIPYINYNQDLRQGFEFGVSYKGKSGDFGYEVGVVGSYLNTCALQRDEIYEYEYQERVGKSLGAAWGLESDGFFASNEEATAANQTFGTAKAGDIKYKDQNGDGVIDTKDEVVLGNWNAPLNMGLNLALSYKGLTLTAMATMQQGGVGMKNTQYDWVYGDRKYTAVVRDRWTAADPESAKYPRLTTQENPNNFRNSDFWMYNTNRFDLSKVQLTYDFPETIVNENSVVKALSVYVAGYDLFTFGPEAERLNTNYWGAPYARLFNLGAKVTF